jgi:hypothetical protein
MTYVPQVEQLVLEQGPQLGPEPATRVTSPPAPLLKEAKVDTRRRAPLWHLGQEVSSSARLKGRRSSNLSSQEGHSYS